VDTSSEPSRTESHGRPTRSITHAACVVNCLKSARVLSFVFKTQQALLLPPLPPTLLLSTSFVNSKKKRSRVTMNQGTSNKSHIVTSSEQD